MQYKFLGNSGLMISRISFGCLNFENLNKINEYYAIFKKAYDLGINMFDVAENYGNNGSSEINLGKCIKKLGVNRDDLVITTKIYFGPDRKNPLS